LIKTTFAEAWWNEGSAQCNRADRALYKFLEQVTADAMTRNAKTVSRGVTLRELGTLFEKEDFNAFPVEENSQVVGLVSKFDYLACFVFTPAHMIPRYDDLMKRTVADVMVDHRLRSMPVVESDQRLAGMISREDVMRALQRCVRTKM
jgi:CBS domain-containing protein